MEPGLHAWVTDHVAPGGAFSTVSHAMNRALTRILQEYEFIAHQCKAKRVAFSPSAFWSLRRDLLEASLPNARGNPRLPGAARVRTVDRVWGYVDPSLVERILTHAEPDGPFSANNPSSHAIEFGLLVLRAAEHKSPVVGGEFPFDGDDLWKRYRARRVPA